MSRATIPLLLLVFSFNVFSATRTWDGGGADANWQTAANWVGDTSPAAGDDLIFAAAALQQSNNNNFFLLTSFNSITIEGGTYTMGGNPIRLVNGLTVSGGTQTLNLSISLNGPQTFMSASGATTTLLILSVGTSALTLDGAGVFGIGLISGSGAVKKTGAGIGAIIAATGFSGPISLNDGIMVVDANIPSSVVTITSTVPTGGTPSISGFGGTGTIGATTVISGAISAGTLTSPTGILNLSNGVTFTTDGAYVCKIGGTTTGAGHDQLNVTGTVTLSNARFLPLPWNGFRPAAGDTYVILRNDGTDAINGTFLNLPEGSTMAGPLGSVFRITYRGGDGNDVAITAINKAVFDYDVDGKSDVSVFRPVNGVWYLNRSTDGASGFQWGASTDKIAPADYDGDGKTDVAVFRPSEGRWYIFNSATSTFSSALWGVATDFPAPGDFDADGRADVAIFRPSDGNWWLDRTTAGTITMQFGQDGDLPVVGDYDGDGRSDIGIFRPSNGVWFIRQSTAGDIGYQWGLGTDKVAHADYDGDGKTDIAVYRPSEGRWYIANSGGNPAQSIYQFGIATDIPVPADYDGDAKTDIAIFRPSDGNWWINRSTAGLIVLQWGQNGDRPTPNAFGN